jgi:toxin ParE1/3/4
MRRYSLENSEMKKNYKVKITASAQSDFRAIWDYISQDNPSNAAEFVSEIEERVNGLSIFPERNPVIPEGELLKSEEYRHVIYKKYRIIYRIRDENVYVLRIFHGSKLLGSLNSL